MASTTIPDVKEALLTKLGTITELTDANADLRYADHPERRRTAVWMGESHLTELEAAGFRAGRRRRHESFVLELYVETRMTNPKDAESKAFEYARAIEEALADDPKLDDTPNLSWVVVESMDSRTTDGGDGSYCTIEMALRCQGSFL